MNRKLFAIVSLALVACGLIALTCISQPATRASSAGQQAPATGIRLSQQSMPGIELISAVPVEMGLGTDMVELTFRNATGQDVLAFAYSRGESPPPAAPQQFFIRNFSLTYKPRVWAAGAVTVVKEPRESDAPVRVNGVEFIDGRVIGEASPVLTLKEDRKRFAEGLASTLKEVKARLAQAGGDRQERARAAVDMLAEIDERNPSTLHQNNNPQPNVVVAPSAAPAPKSFLTNKKNSQADLVIAEVLRQLSYDVGKENALDALAAGLEKAISRNTFKEYK